MNLQCRGLWMPGLLNTEYASSNLIFQAGKKHLRKCLFVIKLNILRGNICILEAGNHEFWHQPLFMSNL